MSAKNREFWRGASVGKHEFYVIPVENIHIEEGWQTREIGDLSGLENELEELGIYGVPPITAVVKDDIIYVRQGHHRLLAARNVIARGIPLEGLRVIPESKTTTDEDHVAQIFTSNQGKQPTVLDTVGVLTRLLNMGWQQSRICKRLNLSPSYVSRLQYLIGIPEELVAAIKADVVSATVVIDAIAADKLDELLVKIRSTESEPTSPNGSVKKPRISSTEMNGRLTPKKAIQTLKEQTVTHLEGDIVMIEMPREVYEQVFGMGG